MSRIRFSRKQLTLPYALFLLFFVVFPLLLIIYYAFTGNDGKLTLNNFVTFFSDNTKLSVLLISAIIGFGNTALCLLLGYPVAMILSNKQYNNSKVIVMLFVMPMWINFVLRIAATRDLLYWIGINGGQYPYLATMIGMVYNYLPFTILPLYTTMLKMDKSLIEASYDLGANKSQTFVKTIIPMTMPGVISAATMVFMPTMSSFVISDVMGENKIQLIGNTIQLNFEQGQWHSGSLIALIMLIIIGISMLLTKNVQKQENIRGSLW